MARCAFISRLEGTMFAHSAGRETGRLMHLERKRRFVTKSGTMRQQ